MGVTKHEPARFVAVPHSEVFRSGVCIRARSLMRFADGYARTPIVGEGKGHPTFWGQASYDRSAFRAFKLIENWNSILFWVPLSLSISISVQDAKMSHARWQLPFLGVQWLCSSSASPTVRLQHISRPANASHLRLAVGYCITCVCSL